MTWTAVLPRTIPESVKSAADTLYYHHNIGFQTVRWFTTDEMKQEAIYLVTGNDLINYLQKNRYRIEAINATKIIKREL
jgi:hypothetical protein